MPLLAVDGIALSPSSEDGIGHDFITRITELDELSRSDFVTILTSNRTWENLTELGTTPWEFGDELRDLTKILVSLLERTRSIEAWAQVAEVYVANEEADPSYHLDAREEGWCEDYYRTSCLLVLGIEVKEDKVEPPPLLTVATDGVLSVRVSGRVELMEGSCGREAPINFRETISNIDECLLTAEAYDPVSLWKEGAFRAAIYLSLNGRHPDYLETWYADDLAFVIRSEFLESLSGGGFLNIDSRIRALLRSISDTLAGASQDRTRPIRTDEGGGAPQVERSTDGARAWRRDVTDEYRLHFWRTSERIELASIGDHNGVEIPE